MKNANPLDWALNEIGCSNSGMQFPPAGWEIIQEWGGGWALRNRNGLRVLVDVSQKCDGLWWLHVSYSRAKWVPTHADTALVKEAFIGDRYAYAVFPPKEQYVNIHEYCLHLWALVDGKRGQVLPEFSGEIAGVKSI